MRQVDNFCVSAMDTNTGNMILAMINDQLKEPVTFQGILDYFNSVTLTQSNRYIKVSCAAYLK